MCIFKSHFSLSAQTNTMKDISSTLLVRYQRYESPVGPLLLAAAGDALCLCDWLGRPSAARNKRRMERMLQVRFVEAPSAVVLRAKEQLDEYFAGRRRAFSLPLRAVGTDFQQRVWNALHEIPFGQTCTYKDIALRLGDVRAVRAVAQAVGSNPLSIVCPCHRVVGSDHTLTGFAGGLAAKRALLELENVRGICGEND